MPGAQTKTGSQSPPKGCCIHLIFLLILQGSAPSAESRKSANCQSLPLLILTSRWSVPIRNQLILNISDWLYGILSATLRLLEKDRQVKPSCLGRGLSHF